MWSPKPVPLQLRRERLARGWTLTKVTVLTGIATSDLGQLERGQRSAFPSWRKKLAELFELSEDVLFAPDPAPGPEPTSPASRSDLSSRTTGDPYGG